MRIVPRFTLPDVLPEDVPAFLRSVRAALDAGACGIAIDLDPLPELDDRVVAALIGVLRAGRERGVETILVVGRPEMRAALALFALDRVFSLTTPDAAAPACPGEGPAKKARRKARPAAAGAAFALALGAASLAGAGASADLTPAQVVANVVDSGAHVNSYRARVDVALHLHSFPFLSQRLAGTTYYKRPANFKVVFDRVPSYERNFETVYSDIDDPSGWPARFTITYAGERVVGDHTDTVLRLVQRVRGMIDHEDVAIDPATWRIDGMEWHYYNGGSIAMTQSYENVDGYAVLARQHADITIPFVNAVADASYHDYRTNVAIDDSVFAQRAK